MKPVPDPVLKGQESVWSFPRPAIAERSIKHIRITHRSIVVAETRRAVRTLETSHPPSYYFPREDVHAALRQSANSSLCEWKGRAIYFDVVVDNIVLRDVAWSYPNPSHDFAMLRDRVAFYPSPFDACFVDGERVTPQAGGFYGGWITSDLAGPFKGVPGSSFW